MLADELELAVAYLGLLAAPHANPRLVRSMLEGIEVDRRKIQRSDSIKEIGEHQLVIRLHAEVTAISFANWPPTTPASSPSTPGSIDRRSAS